MASGEAEQDCSIGSERSADKSRRKRENSADRMEDGMPEMDEEEYDEEWEHEWEDIDGDIFQFDDVRKNSAVRNLYNGRGRGYMRGRGRGRARGLSKYSANWDHKPYYRDLTDSFGDRSRKSRSGFDVDDSVEEDLPMPEGFEMTNLKVKIQDGKRFAEPEEGSQRYSNHRGRFQRGKVFRGHQRSKSPRSRDHISRTGHSDSSRDSFMDCREVLNRRKRLNPNSGDGDLREKLRRRDKDFPDTRMRSLSPVDNIDPRDLIEPPDMHLIESQYMIDPPEASVVMDLNNGDAYQILDSELGGLWKGSEGNIESPKDQDVAEHEVVRRSVERFREHSPVEQFEERRSVRQFADRSEDKFDLRSLERYEGRISMDKFEDRRTPDLFKGRRTPDIFVGRRSPPRFEGRRTPDRFEGRRSPDRFSGRRSPDRFGRGRRSPDRFGGRRSPDRFSGSRRSTDRFSGGRRSPDRFSGGRRSPDRFSGGRSSPDRFSGVRRSPDRFEGRRAPDRFEGRRSPERFVERRSSDRSEGRRSPNRFERRRRRSTDRVKGRRSPGLFAGRSQEEFERRRSPDQEEGSRRLGPIEERLSRDRFEERISRDRFEERISRDRLEEGISQNRFEGRSSLGRFEERRMDQFAGRGILDRFEDRRSLERLEPYENPINSESLSDIKNIKPFVDQSSASQLIERVSVERFEDGKNAAGLKNSFFELRSAGRFEELGSYGRGGSRTALVSRPVAGKRDIGVEDERRPVKKVFPKDKRDEIVEKREERKHEPWGQNRGQEKSIDAKERFGWQNKSRDASQLFQHDSQADQEIDADRKRFKAGEHDGERVREREKDEDRERDKDRARDRNRVKDKDNDRGRDRDRDSDRERPRLKEKSRDGEREHDKDRSRDKDRGREKVRERDSDRENNRERDRNRERVRGRSREREREHFQNKEGIRDQTQGKENSRRRTSERDQVRDAGRPRERSPMRFHRYVDSKFEPKSDRSSKPKDWTQKNVTESKNSRQRENTPPSRDWERIRDNQERRESHSIPFLDDSKGLKELGSHKDKLLSEKGSSSKIPFLDPDPSQKNSGAGWGYKRGSDKWRKEDLSHPPKWQGTKDRHSTHELDNSDSRERTKHRGNHQRNDTQNVVSHDVQKLLDSSHRKANGSPEGDFWQRRSYTPSGDHQWEVSRSKLEQSASRACIAPVEAKGSSFKANRPLDKNALNPPREVIIVRGLAEDIKEDEIRKDISSCGLWPKEVRLVTNSDSGISRGFAFITFNSVDEAARWLELRNGVLKLRPMNHAVMDYSIQNSKDWDCKRCNTQNFRYRTSCHVCSRPKEDCLDGWDEVSPYPTNALILRGLNPATTKSAVAKALEPRVWSRAGPRVDSIEMGVDCHGTPRSVCFVHCRSVVDSIDLHKSLFSEPLSIDGHTVIASYCQLSRIPANLERDAGCGRFGSINVNLTLQTALQANLQANVSNSNVRQQTVVNQVHPSTGVSQEALRSMLEGNFTEKDIPTLAAYCATAYAKTPQEQAAYVRYYTQHYKDKLIKGNAGPK